MLAAPLGLAPGILVKSTPRGARLQDVIETLDESIHPGHEGRLTLAGPEQLVGDVKSGQEREPKRVVDPGLLPHGADPCVEVVGEATDVLRGAFSTDDEALPEDLDLRPRLCHRAPPFALSELRAPRSGQAP